MASEVPPWQSPRQSLGGGDRTQGLSDPRAHGPSSEATASLCMASLTLEGCSTRLQSTRGHLARTCVADGAAKAEATAPALWASWLEEQQHQRRLMRRPAEARSSEEASTTFCSRGPAGRKGVHSGLSPGLLPRFPTPGEGPV